MEIPVHEIDFHPTSFCDRMGRVFWWKGELYRGIEERYASFYKELFDLGIIQKLVEKKFLIETKLTDLSVGGYPMVIKHRRLPFVSYGHEWCPEMLRDAALLTLDMTMELVDHGLILDANTWDMLFDGCHPVYVDFCSIETPNLYENRSWNLFKDDFHSYFIYPLSLMAKGYGHLARLLLSDHEHSIVHGQLAAFMGNRIYNYRTYGASNPPNGLLSNVKRSIPHPARSLASRVRELIKSGLMKLNLKEDLNGFNLLRGLRDELERIQLPNRQRDVEEENRNFPITPSVNWTKKHHTVYEVLSQLRPATVLDMGSGSGWYSQLAASLGSCVVAVDADEKCVGKCYQKAKENNMPILPVVMDIRYPSPGHGICNKVIIPAMERFSCNMVLALSLVHLLVFEQHLNFEQISETFAAFSKEWLLVEFIPPEAPDVHGRWSKRYSWYTLAGFIDILSKKFQSVSIMPYQSDSGVLLLCQK